MSCDQCADDTVKLSQCVCGGSFCAECKDAHVERCV